MGPETSQQKNVKSVESIIFDHYKGNALISMKAKRLTPYCLMWGKPTPLPIKKPMKMVRTK